MTRGRTIAAAVVGSAKMRATFKHLAWNLEVRLTRVAARALGPAARILRDAADFRSVGFVLLRIPIGRPFPDIADHVVQAVTVCRKCGDGRGAFEAISRKILVREITLPSVCHMPAAGELLV